MYECIYICKEIMGGVRRESVKLEKGGERGEFIADRAIFSKTFFKKLMGLRERLRTDIVGSEWIGKPHGICVVCHST